MDNGKKQLDVADYTEAKKKLANKQNFGQSR